MVCPVYYYIGIVVLVCGGSVAMAIAGLVEAVAISSNTGDQSQNNSDLGFLHNLN
jgi:hypothetical protein